jgi:hypothetical protein
MNPDLLYLRAKGQPAAFESIHSDVRIITSQETQNARELLRVLWQRRQFLGRQLASERISQPTLVGAGRDIHVLEEAGNLQRDFACDVSARPESELSDLEWAEAG